MRRCLPPYGIVPVYWRIEQSPGGGKKVAKLFENDASMIEVCGDSGVGVVSGDFCCRRRSLPHRQFLFMKAFARFSLKLRRPTFPGPTAVSQRRWRFGIIDDHCFIRSVFGSLAEDSPDLEMAWGAGCFGSARERLRQDRPDFLIVDVNLPDGNGFDFTAEMQQRYPDLPILMVSSNEGVECARRAIENGARGYLCKRSTLQEIMDAMFATIQGEYYVKPLASVVFGPAV